MGLEMGLGMGIGLDSRVSIEEFEVEGQGEAATVSAGGHVRAAIALTDELISLVDHLERGGNDVVENPETGPVGECEMFPDAAADQLEDEKLRQVRMMMLRGHIQLAKNSFEAVHDALVEKGEESNFTQICKKNLRQRRSLLHCKSKVASLKLLLAEEVLRSANLEKELDSYQRSQNQVDGQPAASQTGKNPLRRENTQKLTSNMHKLKKREKSSSASKSHPAVEWPMGQVVEKHFPKHGIFRGKIVSYSSPYYKIRYEDGDEEEMSAREVGNHVVNNSGRNYSESAQVDLHKKLNGRGGKSNKRRRSGSEKNSGTKYKKETQEIRHVLLESTAAEHSNHTREPSRRVFSSGGSMYWEDLDSLSQEDAEDETGDGQEHMNGQIEKETEGERQPEGEAE